jgi:leucine dehydrogenase
MVTIIKHKIVNPAHSATNRLLRYADEMGLNEIHIKADPETDLYAIVAIHSTKFGPALGGCRCINYHNLSSAIVDATRLARGMTYKAAISGLPQGGGKAVLMRPQHIKDRHAYFAAYGKFINDLGGRYITAVDSGTTTADMDIIAQYTNYVTSTTSTNGFPGDPSPLTALGVRRGIEAAVAFKLGKNTLEGLHVAIQGVGQVGYPLAQYLYELGAKLTVCDVNSDATFKCVTDFGAQVVGVDEIFKVPCDIFAPCALGAVINDDVLASLDTKIIAGSANNQLAETRHGKLLHERGILYAPDYVINAGGLIHAVAQYNRTSIDDAHDQIIKIYDTLTTIFERSKESNMPTNEIADAVAAERLAQ